MNSIYSDHEIDYKKRDLGPKVESALGSFPVVAITGPRQVGKSTFLRNEFSGFHYINLDDFSLLGQAREDPGSLWEGHDEIIIDEVQKAPRTLEAVKLEVDRSKRKKRFLLSGSSNLLLMSKVTESLAGRAIYLEMLPFTYREMKGRGGKPSKLAEIMCKDFRLDEKSTKKEDPLPYILRGSLPPLLGLSDLGDMLLWWEGYVRTYLERDLRELSQIENLVDFRRLLGSLALMTGSVMNQSALARDTGISQPTVYRYIKLLEVSNLLVRVPPFTASRSKRIVKSPKLYYIDPGLSAFLAGYHDMDSLRDARELGGLFECLVHLQLRADAELQVPRIGIYYWRTSGGREVDFVLEQGRDLVAVEVKMTTRPSYNDIKNLLGFLDEHPRAVRGLLVHAGSAVRHLHGKVIAVPWWWLGS
ncbi:MAG: ATP-binding protein [Actinomycetota bacterium]|nr:ATP-binding protein [Actinomycetota bacterium]